MILLHDLGAQHYPGVRHDPVAGHDPGRAPPAFPIIYIQGYIKFTVSKLEEEKVISSLEEYNAKREYKGNGEHALHALAVSSYYL